MSDVAERIRELEAALVRMLLQYCADTHEGKAVVFSRNMVAGQEALAALGLDEGVDVAWLEKRLDELEGENA